MDKQNENYSNNSANLQDYEIEVADKKGFLSNLFSKLKTSREQKLLNSATSEKRQTTGQSISFLWGFGNFRTSLFNTLDNVRKSLFQKSNSNQMKNTLDTHIIGENSPEATLEKTPGNPETAVEFIVPVSKSSSKSFSKEPITLPNEKTTNDQNKLEESENGLESSDTEENKSSNSVLKVESLDASAATEKNLQSNIPKPEFTAPKEAESDVSEKDDR